MRELTWFPLLQAYPKTSAWGARVDPITGAVGSWHRGVDYGVPFGEPVIAPFDGEVTTGYEDGAGYWSWVVAGADMFKSFHHSTYAIPSGWVSAGTTIAYIGSSGSSTGAHAHLELWDAGVNIDPTGYLDRAPLIHGDKPQPPGDEMTDEDWQHMASMLNTMIVSKLAGHSTPGVMLGDDHGHFTVVMTNDGPRRYVFRSGAEAAVAAKVGLVAPQKPMAPPAPCPAVLDVDTLPGDERDALYSYPTL
jgi:hypothetical protein